MEFLDSKWSSHAEVTCCMIRDLRLVEDLLQRAANDAAAQKSWNKLFSSLMDGADKKNPAAFLVLSSVISQVSDQPTAATFAERLPTKLISAFKSSSVSKGPLIECTTALVKCLGQVGGPVKKLLASFVGAIFPVLVGLVQNVTVTRVACECVIECATSVSATVAPKAASVKTAGLHLLWSSPEFALGARLLAESVLLERGDGAWSAAVECTFRAMSVVAHRACPKEFASVSVDDSAWLSLPAEKGRDAVDDFARLSVLVTSLFRVVASRSRKVILPTPSAIDHFYRVLRSDPALKPNPSLLAVKRMVLDNFGFYCVVAQSALLMHHARVTEILLASLSWAQSHRNATIEHFLNGYALYVQHVPVGHLEKTLYHSVMSMDANVIAKHMALLVECRPGLWASLPSSRRAFLEHHLASLVLSGTPDAVSTSARILLASSKQCVPLLAVALNGAGMSAHLSALALRSRPPAPIWPNQQPLYEDAQSHGQQQQYQHQQQQHIFAEFAGLMPVAAPSSPKRIEGRAEEEEERLDEPKRARFDPGEVVKVAEQQQQQQQQQQQHRSDMVLSSFQPPLQVHSFAANDDDDEEEQEEEMPMIVDASPSNSDQE